MIVATKPLSQTLTFADFIQQLPDEEGKYELVNGEIMRILATRKHENVADFIQKELYQEIDRFNLNYRISSRIVIKTLTNTEIEQGRHPDISIVDKTLWERNLSAYSAVTEPLQLFVEVVSTNWEDDYIDKFNEYQRLGISEYWIVDYLAISSRSYLGTPKKPTIFVCVLDENGVYQMNTYQDENQIISPTFPELNLTVSQIING